MRLLVDTHVLIWWVLDLPNLGPAARAKLRAADTEVNFSVASLWEMAIKISLGRLDISIPDAIAAYEGAGFRQLEIGARHLATLSILGFIHRDPFDRLFVAQAIAEGLTIMTSDRTIPRYPVRTIDCS